MITGQAIIISYDPTSLTKRHFSSIYTSVGIKNQIKKMRHLGRMNKRCESRYQWRLRCGLVRHSLL